MRNRRTQIDSLTDIIKVWHGVKGFRNSPYGERRIGGNIHPITQTNKFEESSGRCAEIIPGSLMYEG